MKGQALVVHAGLEIRGAFVLRQRLLITYHVLHSAKEIRRLIPCLRARLHYQLLLLVLIK